MEIEQIISSTLPQSYFEKRSAIELFAREGTMGTADWASSFNRIVACDVNKSYLNEFEENWPASETVCIDSVAALRSGELCTRVQNEKFDFVSSDNPQGLYGDNYCEHFDFIEFLPGLCKPGGFLFFLVNLNPFRPSPNAVANDVYCQMDDEWFENWMYRREVFYGKTNFSWEDAILFYMKFFRDLGFPSEFAYWRMRKSALVGHPDHLMYLLLKLKKV